MFNYMCIDMIKFVKKKKSMKFIVIWDINIDLFYLYV